MPRLFTGIELPSPVKDRLAMLKSPLPGARWVDPANLHITLRFVGDIENHIAQEFADGLAGINIPAFEVRLSGLDVFGGKDPRGIWAGFEPCAELELLARANERAARFAGLSAERRSFKPHVTLARLHHSRPRAVAQFLEHCGAFRSESFAVERFVLFSARPNTGGGPYVVEEDFPLAGCAPVSFEDNLDDVSP